MHRSRTAFLTAFALTALTALTAPGSGPLLADALTSPPKLLLDLISRKFKWEIPAEPLKIVGPVHSVGTEGLGVWLVTTDDGHILINTGARSSGPMIAASIRKLGYRPEDIRLMLTGHAHVDHVGGHAYLKALSGAQVAMLEGDIGTLETGGRADFFYGTNLEVMGFDPVKVDRVLRDGEVIRLGNVGITVLSTPGHTRGSASFITEVTEGGTTYTVLFPDGTGVNPGYRVARDPSYPGIGDDFRRTFNRLALLEPDIWLAPHAEFFDFAGKRERAKVEGVRAWVDREGYQRWLKGKREAFEKAVEKEGGGNG